MNQMDNENIPMQGIVLTDNVNMEWIKSLEPQYNPGFCKFVINIDSNRIAVGMDYHRDAETLLSNTGIEPLYGGNLFFDGTVVYESTLNQDRNVKSKWFKKHPGNPRIITDPEVVEMLNSRLHSWIDF